MTNYRGFCHVKGEERPRQQFFPTRSGVMDWASETLTNVPEDTTVEVYEITEKLIDQFYKRAALPMALEIPNCYCGIRAYCPQHPELGWQKGRKA